jgi:glutathione S-transferase
VTRREETMPLEFYWASGSCNSWRAHLALELKKVPYQAHLLQMSKKEHKAALAAWVKRIESIPGYERTYPPHWRA